MESDDLDLSLEDSSADYDHIVVHLPLTTATTPDGDPLRETDIEAQIDDARIVVQPLSESSDENLQFLFDETGSTPDSYLEEVVNCCTFLRKIGTEILIYSTSFAGIGVTTGLLIRFANTPALASMIIGNGLAVIANENGRAFFTSLLKPHSDEVPEEKRKRFDLIRKYAAHPLSTIMTSTVGGTIVSIVGSTNLGTRQSIVSCTAQLGGLTTYLANQALRKCHGGRIIVNPGHDDPKPTMQRFYSSAPNPEDNNRSYRAGNLRNIVTRVTCMAMATTTAYMSGAYYLENYCGPGRDTLLAMDGNFTGDDLQEYCMGGQATFLFRDWGVTAINFVGFMVVQPLLNRGFNALYDCFWGPADEDSDETRLAEVLDSDESSDVEDV